MLTHAARAAAKPPLVAARELSDVVRPSFEANRFKNRGRVRAAYNARRALVRARQVPPSDVRQIACLGNGIGHSNVAPVLNHTPVEKLKILNFVL